MAKALKKWGALKKRNTKRSWVFLLTTISFSSRFRHALQQNRTQSRPLYLLNQRQHIRFYKDYCNYIREPNDYDVKHRSFPCIYFSDKSELAIFETPFFTADPT